MTDEGRLVPNGSNYDSEYFIKDHLGNTRVVVQDNNGKAEVMQESHYYPFGMTMEGMSYSRLLSGVEANKYLYNGKELQDDLGLDWYDYGARMYDAQLARFHTLDPKTEEYNDQSPYLYAGNNPIKFIDLNGENEWNPVIKDGHIYFETEAGDTGESLKNFLGGNENAKEFVAEKSLNSENSYKEGTLIPMKSNSFTEATLDAKNNSDRYTTGGDDTYNCHTSAIKGIKGESFINAGNMETSQRDKAINTEFVNTSPSKATFGKTAVTFGFAHTAVYFGKSKDGSVNIFTVNGQGAKPAIMKVTNLAKNEDGMSFYGPVRNIQNNHIEQQNTLNKKIDIYGRIGNGGSGYYNLKTN